MRRIIYLVCILLMCWQAKAQEWTPLFNGKDLSNFTVLNGSAEYVFDNETVVGVSKMNTPNTFLATKKKYGDFILEFEVLIDKGLNSGVQIRSISDPSISEGRVHGYQVEIETGQRKWSGGIYDEARRGWLYPLSVNDNARGAFKVPQWNHYRIEAVGSEIRTWVNDIPCARLSDDLTLSGIIAFQVHGIGDEKLAGKKVRWRNMRILTEDIEAHRKTTLPEIHEVSYLKNILSAHEKENGWELLWDGRTYRNWALQNTASRNLGGWRLENGEMITTATKDNIPNGDHDHICRSGLSDFILELDFMVTDSAQSGIIYFGTDGQPREYQIADDRLFDQADQKSLTTGSLNGVIAAGNLSEEHNDLKRYWGVGNWSKARIVARNGIIEHWLNQIKVVEYEGEVKGPTILQNQGSEVHFRSIKLKRLE